MKRLDQLTFTRFIAILIVLFYHGGGGVYLQAINIPLISPILISATTSVTYLYVLSGFVMSLVNFHPNERFNIDKYWTARFVRLYPLYLISFLLVCYYYIDFVARVKLQKTLVNVLVLQAWIPRYAQSFNYASWSMTVEFFFYALFPFFTLWAYRQSTKKLIWISIILWALSQIVHNVLWIGYFPVQENFLVYFPLFHLSSFILGAVGGIWYLRDGSGQKIRTSTTLFVFAGGIFLASVYIVISSGSTKLPHGLELMTGLLAPILTIIIIALAIDKSRFSSFLNNRALVTLGDSSYGLYILHVPAIWLYLRALENSSLADPQLFFDYTFLPLMIAFVLLTHFYIDQPFRIWLKQIFQHVSMPLLLLNLVVLTLSIYLAFRLRIGFGREFIPYRNFALLMFWSAFILRTVFSVGFDVLNPGTLYGTQTQFVRPVLISVTAGSAALALIGFFGYSIGWFENFPRSIFLTDWAIMFTLSLITRYLIKRSGFNGLVPKTT
jgi:peptidoglycan/LPS O-acetylase OafA/YrhL